MATSLTRPSRALLVWSMITSVSGQAADVRVMSSTTLDASSRCTSYTRPRSTTLMPSSGSTTSFIASVTSSTDTVDVPAAPVASGTSGRSPWSTVCSAIALLHRLFEFDRRGGRVLPRHPGEEGALHAGGELRDACERDPVLQHVLVRLHVA